MIHPFLQDRLPEIQTILQRHHINSAYAFGSVCTNNFNEKSDIDLLVNFDENLEPLERGELFWTVLEALEKALNRKVDLLTMKSLSNPYFIEELNETKVHLYGKAS